MSNPDFSGSYWQDPAGVDSSAAHSNGSPAADGARGGRRRSTDSDRSRPNGYDRVGRADRSGYRPGDDPPGGYGRGQAPGNGYRPGTATATARAAATATRPVAGHRTDTAPRPRMALTGWKPAPRRTARRRARIPHAAARPARPAAGTARARAVRRARAIRLPGAAAWTRAPRAPALGTCGTGWPSRPGSARSPEPPRRSGATSSPGPEAGPGLRTGIPRARPGSSTASRTSSATAAPAPGPVPPGQLCRAPRAG